MKTVKLEVHRFTMSDVEDVDLYVAQPIYEWQQTEAGQFIMTHCITSPTFVRNLCHNTFGWKVSIVSELTEQDAVLYRLKFT